MIEDKQCLQRDTTECRCLEEGCGKNMLDVCCIITSSDEYVAVIKTGNECELQNYMLLPSKLRYGGLLDETVVPAKFLLMSLNTLPEEHETPNALVVVWSLELSTLRITDRDTAQTERILIVTHLWTAVWLLPLYPESRKECLHTIHVLIDSRLVLPTRDSHAEAYDAPPCAPRAWWRSCGCSISIHIDPSWQRLMSCSQGLVSLENETETSVSKTRVTVNQQLSPGDSASRLGEVTDTRTLGKPKAYECKAAEWTAWQ